MDILRGSPTRPWVGLLVAVAALAGMAWADQPPVCTVPLYARQGNLQATLLATRGRYQAWLSRQAAAVAAVKLGPWCQATETLGQTPEAAVLTTNAAGLAAKDSRGQALWAAQGWKDGGFVKVAPCRGDGNVAYLARTLTAPQAVALTVGAGGGERMDLWLNGKKLYSAPTRIVMERYGTGERPENSHVDQVILDLDLPAGESCLVVRLETRGDNQFCFSLSPQPAEAIWPQVRADFSGPVSAPGNPRPSAPGDFAAADNPLLSLADAEWFDRPGWLGARDTQREQKLVASLADSAGPMGAKLRTELSKLATASTPPSDSRWLDLCAKAADYVALSQEIHRLSLAARELAKSFPQDYPAADFLARLDSCRARVEKMLAGPIGGDAASTAGRDAAARHLLADLAPLSREILLTANPLLKNKRLMFVRRYTYDSQHYYDDYYHGVREFGGNLCELNLADGQVRQILPQMASGIFDRYDLSFDAKRVAFGYRPPKSGGFRLYEATLDGQSVRQLTVPPSDENERIARYAMYPSEALERDPRLYGHWTDDMHPCYLPDGRIAFVSSRCERSVLCGGHSLTTTCLHRINADGSGLAPLSTGTLSEFTPTMLADGRILYNRWEYVCKGIAAIQPLWAMRPDGSGTEEVYGDNITNPGVFVQARQVPGHENLIVCLGCGHEPLSVGAILLLDLNQDKRKEEVMTSLTPDTTVRSLRGLWQRRNGRWREDVHGPFYCDPFPLSDKFFLVSCNPDRRYNDRSAYGVWLIDAFGNRIRIHQDPEMSCFQPMVLAERPVPPALPPVQVPCFHDPARGAEGRGSMSTPGYLDGQHASPPSLRDAVEACHPDQATLVMTDVYQGLDGVPRGTVKYIRVMEQIPRPWSAWQGRDDDGIPGQMVAVSWFSHIWIAVMHGVVPVKEDGSASFLVPARRNVFFQALDKDFMEIQRMRTFVSYQSGEQRSCIGCHESRKHAPVGGAVMAMQSPPVLPSPQPGDTVAHRPLYYPSDVQPVLDRHCVRCHSGPKPKANLDLTGEMTQHFSRSYESLMRRGDLVSVICEWSQPPGAKPKPYGGSMDWAEATPPYTFGSHKSKLIAHLRKGHSDVKLSQEEWVKLVTWVDSNAQYYGSYFGRRNLRYKGMPDFRPTPTWESACGVCPPPVQIPRPPDVEARLLAWWKLDESSGDKAADASPGRHDARVVGPERVPGRKTGQALRMTGLNYVEAAGLGTHETISVAMWVKADSLEHTWSPLLFTNNWQPSSFHLSLVPGGAVNLAVNAGHDIHNRSFAAVGDGRWHHVAVVCDARPNGVLRFYIDGKRDRQIELNAGIPLVLDGLRLGGYNGWQGQARNNFHGCLDDVRIYSGMLSDKQVAEVAKGDE